MSILDNLAIKWINYRQDKRIEEVKNSNTELGEEWKLHKAVAGSKEFEIVMAHPSIYIFADEAAAFLKDNQADNYVQFDMLPRIDRGKKPIRVTVQWAKGESPALQNARLRSELAISQTRLTLTEAALSAAGEYIKLIEGDAIAYTGREVFERVEWGYKRERDAYYAARDALNGVTK